MQRFPDYWELVSAGKESVDSLSAFRTAPEKTTQFDTGVVWSSERIAASLAAFYSDIDDYIDRWLSVDDYIEIRVLPR